MFVGAHGWTHRFTLGFTCQRAHKQSHAQGTYTEEVVELRSLLLGVLTANGFGQRRLPTVRLELQRKFRHALTEALL